MGRKRGRHSWVRVGTTITVGLVGGGGKSRNRQRPREGVKYHWHWGGQFPTTWDCPYPLDTIVPHSHYETKIVATFPKAQQGHHSLGWGGGGRNILKANAPGHPPKALLLLVEGIQFPTRGLWRTQPRSQSKVPAPPDSCQDQITPPQQAGGPAPACRT